MISGNLHNSGDQIEVAVTQKIEDIKPTIEAKGYGESSPLVKHKDILNTNKETRAIPINLTFKDLSYSVQVKNTKKQSIHDPKCKLNFNTEITVN